MTGDANDWRRPPAPSPYHSSGRVLVAPRALLGASLQALQSVGSREGACLWLGDTDGRHAYVRGLIIPRQLNRPLNYTISTEAMKGVAEYARPRGWTLLANVHSHPGRGVEHSRYDDEMMPGRNALSLVFPHYGKWAGHWATGVGVHEFVDMYWHLLPDADAQGRVLWDGVGRLTVEDLR